MALFENILQAVGGTPLVRLNSITHGIGSPVYAKAEFLNPEGSVKDRIGIAMIEAAEKEGLLKPGGTIIEATAGNTGIGLAQAAAIKGYRCIFVLPDKMSQEKINLLKAYGAEVVITPTSVPPDSPESYNGVADRLTQEIPGAFHPNQFMNQNNPLAHYRTTGPEIWNDSQGKVEVFVAGMGTGGTISGTARFLKEQNPNIIVVGADPEGSILSGDSPHSYKVEGIGEDFIPGTFNRQVVDEMIRVSDKESFNTARRLAREEGILAGGSAGTAVAAAIKYAKRIAEPRFIVALLPDTGRNYINRIFSDSWMMENGFWQDGEVRIARVGDILDKKQKIHGIISIEPEETLDRVVQLMRKYSISQIPVVENSHVVGSVNEASLMKLLHDGVDFARQQVSAVMGKPLPTMDEKMDISEAYRVLLSGTTGIVVYRGGFPTGVITRSDIIEYWMKQKENR
ncbi:MAG: cystathionine beta-synthase [Candidatus Latescibacter sp.]|nr:cystathionine beta-synthase [Candidatus Latescibacter sp.]